MSSGLTGKTIVNTRASHQADTLHALLHDKGAVVLDYPCIAIVPPEDSHTLDNALRDLLAGSFDWLVLTSINTVWALAQRLQILALSLHTATFQTAAIGSATATAAQEYLGLAHVVIPPEYVAESLADHLPIAPGTRIFLPESAIARPTLAAQLTARGADVHVVTAYQTICDHSSSAMISQQLAQKSIDAIIFTSSSTVTCFLERIREENSRYEDVLQLCAACIGPKTAATARDCGFSVITVPTEYTLEGLVAALEAYFTHEQTSRGKYD